MSGFVNIPVSSTSALMPVSGFHGLPQTGPPPTNLQAWAFWYQFYLAIQEKTIPFGCGGFFPSPNQLADSGTCGDITNNGDGTLTIDFSFDAGHWDTGSACSSTRWVDYVCTVDGESLCYIPENYDLIIVPDPSDPWTVVRGLITGMSYSNNTGATSGTLTVDAAGFLDSVVAKFNSSLSAIGNQQFYIMKAGGLWIDADAYGNNGRRLTKPNQQEAWKGTVGTGYLNGTNVQLQQVTSDYNIDTYDNPSTNPNVQWNTDQFAGKDLLTFVGTPDADGTTLKRLTIKGNSSNTIYCGQSVYKLTVTANCTLTVTTNAGSGSANILAAATATNIATAINGIGLVTGTTVTGTGPFTVTFSTAQWASLTATTGGTVTHIDAATALTGNFIIVTSGYKAMPGRFPEQLVVWYRGVMGDYLSHDALDNQTSTSKPTSFAVWQDLNADDDCDDYEHDAFDIDAQIELNNECECSRAGDFVAPNMWKTIRGMQIGALRLIGSYIDTTNTWGDGSVLSPNFFTPATWFNAINPANGWTSTISYSAGPPASISIGTHSAPYYPFNVYWTEEDSHGGYINTGTGQLTSDGHLTGTGLGSSDDGNTIILSFGLTAPKRLRQQYLYPKSSFLPDISTVDEVAAIIDPAAVTGEGQIDKPATVTLTPNSGGGTLTHGTTYWYQVTAFNGSGETDATTEQSVTTTLSGFAGDTFTVTISWTAVEGASGYNIYGRTSGSEQKIGSTSLLTFIDDNSVTPSGSPPGSNTTSNDCNGVGTWIYRDRSRNYFDVDEFGFGGTNPQTFAAGDLARYLGNYFAEPFTGEAPVQTANLLSPYFDKFFRGTYAKNLQTARDVSRKGIISTSTKWSLTDSSKSWWTDAGINTGQMRVQGGVATGGSTTTLVDTGGMTGDKVCWFPASRFAGTIDGVSASVYYNFILEIYKGALPEGWATAADGTATYTEPSTSGSGTTTAGTAPTISSTRPSVPVGDGRLHTFVIVGNNFQTGCVVTFTDPSSNVYVEVPTIVSAGVLSLSFAFPVGGSWTFTAANGTHVSSPYSLTVQTCYRVPITSGATGWTATFTAVSGLTVAASDGYLIREPHYELSKWRGRTATLPDGTVVDIIASDDDTLYFAAQSDAPDGSYVINEFHTGVVLKYVTSAPSDLSKAVKIGTNQYWAVPTGLDTRLMSSSSSGGSSSSSGLSVSFAVNPAWNQETKVKGYGLWTVWDDLVPAIPNELAAGIKLLTTTARNVDFRSRADLATPENNSAFAAVGDEPETYFWAASNDVCTWSYPTTCNERDNMADSLADAETDLQYLLANQTSSFPFDPMTGDPLPPSGNCNAGPTSYSETEATTGVPAKSAACGFVQEQESFLGSQCMLGLGTGGGVSAQYMYGTVSGVPTCISCSIDFYNYADTPPGTPPHDMDWVATPDSTWGVFLNGSSLAFDAMGDSVAYHVWTKWDTETPDGDGLAVSIKLGSITFANLPSMSLDPSTPDKGYQETGSATSGYKVTNAVGILTWDFVYV